MRLINKSRRTLAVLSTLLLLGVCEKRGVSLESRIGGAGRGVLTAAGGMTAKARAGGFSPAGREPETAEAAPPVIRGILKLSISVSLARRRIKSSARRLSALPNAGRTLLAAIAE